MRPEFENCRNDITIPILGEVIIQAEGIKTDMPMRFPHGTKFSIGEYIVLVGNTIGQIVGVNYNKKRHCMIVQVRVVED